MSFCSVVSGAMAVLTIKVCVSMIRINIKLIDFEFMGVFLNRNYNLMEKIVLFLLI